MESGCEQSGATNGKREQKNLKRYRGGEDWSKTAACGQTEPLSSRMPSGCACLNKKDLSKIKTISIRVERGRSV